MAFIKIEDAPFTDEEKKKILAMGVTEADWGYPNKVLEDPVAHFERMNSLGMELVGEGGAGLTKHENNEEPQPFGEGKMNEQEDDYDTYF